MQLKNFKKVLSITVYILSILFANLFVFWFGVFNVLSVSIPAGAVFIGVSFTARDYVQWYTGSIGCWYWMLIASLISVLFSKSIALASFTAFILSEGADWLVFTRLRCSFKKRVIFSNIISIPIDSLVFVPMVFGWDMSTIIGQAVVKIFFSVIILINLKENEDDRVLSR